MTWIQKKWPVNKYVRIQRGSENMIRVGQGRSFQLSYSHIFLLLKEDFEN